MNNSTNFERLELTPRMWQALRTLMTRTRHTKVDRVIISKEPSSVIYNAMLISGKDQYMYLLYPDGSVAKSPMSD